MKKFPFKFLSGCLRSLSRDTAVVFEPKKCCLHKKKLSRFAGQNYPTSGSCGIESSVLPVTRYLLCYKYSWLKTTVCGAICFSSIKTLSFTIFFLCTTVEYTKTKAHSDIELCIHCSKSRRDPPQRPSVPDEAAGTACLCFRAELRQQHSFAPFRRAARRYIAVNHVQKRCKRARSDVHTRSSPRRSHSERNTLYILHHQLSR